VALSENHQYEESLRLRNDYINSFSREDQDNTSQIFNAWWLLLKTYNKFSNDKKTKKCKKELLKQLPNQNYNEYVYKEMRNHLVGKGDKPKTIL